MDGSAWTASDCTRRMVRGGSWGDKLEFFHSAIRMKYITDYRYFSFIGFRVGRTLTP